MLLDKLGSRIPEIVFSGYCRLGLATRDTTEATVSEIV